MKRFALSRRASIVLVLGVSAVATMTLLLRLHVGGETGATWIGDTWEPAIILLSAAFIFSAVRVLGFSGVGRPWLLIGLGLLAYGVGDVIWSVIEIGQGRQVPYPGPPDVFYILMYPLVAFGLLIAVLGYRQLVNIRRPLLLAGTFTLLLGVGIYFGFLVPYVLSQDLSKGEAALDVVYPMADVIFILGPAVAIALVVGRLGGGRLARPWWSVIFGVACFALGDIGYSYLSARGLYASGSLTDVAWSLAAVAIAFGAALVLDLAQPRTAAQSEG